MTDTKMEAARALVEEAQTKITHVRNRGLVDRQLVEAVEKLAEAVAMVVSDLGRGRRENRRNN